MLFSVALGEKGLFYTEINPRLYSSPNDASSQTGTTWEVAQESEQAAESSLGWCVLQENKTNQIFFIF